MQLLIQLIEIDDLYKMSMKPNDYPTFKIQLFYLDIRIKLLF